MGKCNSLFFPAWESVYWSHLQRLPRSQPKMGKGPSQCMPPGNTGDSHGKKRERKRTQKGALTGWPRWCFRISHAWLDAVA